MKNVAFASYSFNNFTISFVYLLGPSSKVRAIVGFVKESSFLFGLYKEVF